MSVNTIIADGGKLAQIKSYERRAIEQEAFFCAMQRLDEEDHDRIAGIIREYTTGSDRRSPIPGLSHRGMTELLAKLGIFLSAADPDADGRRSRH